MGKQKIRQRERAESMVEMAFSHPHHHDDVMGTLVLGRGIYDYNAITNGANEGARWLAGTSTSTDPLTYETAPFPNTVAAVNAELGPMLGPLVYGPGTPPNNVNVQVTTSTVPAYVTVTVAYTFSPLTAILIGGASVPLEASASLLLH